MLDEEADFDFGAWCPVCDRAIPSSSASGSAGTSAVAGSHAQAAPDLQRALSGSSHGAATSSAGVGGHAKGKERRKKEHPPALPVATGGPLPQRRNKSSTRLHHAANRTHHGRATTSHSHSNLAPLTTNPSPPPTPAPPLEVADAHPALNPPTSLYCSEECRRIDEMRSRLAFADLGPSAPRVSSHSPAPPPAHHLPSPSRGGEAEDLMASMSRRRLSGTSLAVASPPREVPGVQWGSTSSLASRSQSSTSLAQQLVVGSAPALDFSTRRNSNNRGATEGGYSYRPSLMQRVPSSDDGLPQLGEDRRHSAPWSRTRGSSDSLASMGEADERSERGFSLRPPSALSALRFMTPISKSASSSPPIHHHPSTLAYAQSQPDARHRRAPHLARHNTDAPRATSYHSDSKTDPNRDESAIYTSPPPASPRMLEKRSVSDPGGLAAAEGDSDASLPHMDNNTARPTPSMSRSVSTARRPPRTNSSASLALMGTSLGKSYVPRSLERHGGWSAPKRSESTASLSGLVATGKILPVATLTPSLAHGSFHPAIPRVSTSPSSPSSNSSFAQSHSSTRSSQRSTAGSSEHPDHRTSLASEYGNFYDQRHASSSSLAGYSSRSPQLEPDLASSPPSKPNSNGAQRPSTNRGGRRSNQGLMMTPSTSSLSGAGSSYGDGASSDMGRPSSSGQGRREHSTAERTPTQSLSKATSIHAVSHTDVTGLDPETTPLASGHRRRSNESRAMSTPGTARRPHPPDFSRPQLMGASPPVNAAGVNPSLSYLYPNGPPAGSPPPPSMLASKSRNWSWDHLPVPTYTALDVDQVRRQRATGSTLLGEGTAAMQGAPPPPAKERKRLFYFSDVE